MEGNGVHAFKWVNAQGEYVYVKYKWTPQQARRNFTAAEASAKQAQDIQHATTDLYDAIRRGDYPAWELSVQVLPAADLDKFDFYPLDPTKIWPEDKLPSVKVGRMVLNRIPKNFFEEVEQAAFSPGTLVPGIEPSEDRLLQGRLFSYHDTQRHRIGANFQRVPVNAAQAPVNSTNQDGAFSNRGTGSEVNYQPSASQPEFKEAPGQKLSSAPLSGRTQQEGIAKTLNFAQAGETYRSFSEAEKANLIATLSGELSQVKNTEVVKRMVSYFYRADADYGKRLIAALKLNAAEVVGLANTLTVR
jgi:catalase